MHRPCPLLVRYCPPPPAEGCQKPGTTRFAGWHLLCKRPDCCFALPLVRMEKQIMSGTRWAAIGTVLVAGVLGLRSAGTAADAPDARQWDRTVECALGYLRTAQSEDGSWSRP